MGEEVDLKENDGGAVRSAGAALVAGEWTADGCATVVSEEGGVADAPRRRLRDPVAIRGTREERR